MKKILKIIGIVFFVVIIGIQFIRPERTNPPIVQAETLEANINVPENVKGIMKRSCDDCHTNRTVYPWYSNISPLSWGVVDHINEGRDELNFSKWGTYEAKRKKRKLIEVCEEVESRNMPHYQYLWLHWDAKVSDADIKVLCDWSKAESEKIVE